MCYICKEKFEDKHAKDIKYEKVTDHFHYVEVLHIVYVIWSIVYLNKFI